MLRESLQNFTPTVYERVKRGVESYKHSEEFTYQELERLVLLYKTKKELQLLRLIRDNIDHHLRRYHKYSIKENFGGHYKQVDITGSTIFEHVVPNSIIRDLLINEIISPKQACNMPTCTISVENNLLLRKNKMVNSTPDIFYFWKRYQVCNGEFVDCFGNTVDMNMSLEDHFKLFGID